MRILNEKYLSLVWSWDDVEKNGLALKYGTNLERLLFAIQERFNHGEPPPPEDLKELAGELQQAGELLSQSMQNCFEAGRALYGLAAPTPAAQNERKDLIARLKNHIGKPVILKQTHIAEIRGKVMILEEIRGIKAIVRDGEQRWESLIDFLVPVLRVEPNK